MIVICAFRSILRCNSDHRRRLIIAPGVALVAYILLLCYVCLSLFLTFRPIPPPAPHWLSRLFSHLCPLCALSLSFIYSLIHSLLFSLGLGCSLFMHILSLLHYDIFVCLFGQALQKHCQRLLSKDLKSIIYVHISSLEHTHKHTKTQKHTRIHKHILVWIVGFCRTLERLHDFLSVGCWLWFFSHGLQVLN